MADIRFLRYGEVLEIHAFQLRVHGGDWGCIDRGVVRSAVHAPQDVHAYSQIDDVFELAAVYVYHIANGHGFVDGNKRTGLAAGLLFLDLNGYDWPPLGEDLDQEVLDLVAGKISKADMAERLREVFSAL